MQEELTLHSVRVYDGHIVGVFFELSESYLDAFINPKYASTLGLNVIFFFPGAEKEWNWCFHIFFVPANRDDFFVCLPECR